MSELTRFFPSQGSGPPELKTLWVTNMWPDEVRPYYGNYICSQGESLWAAGLDVDVLYIRGLLTQRAYFTTLPEVRRRVSDPRYRVIHAHYGHTAAVAVATRSRPLVISFCGEDLLGAPRDSGNTLKSTIESKVFRQLPRFAAATITKSEEMERSLPPALQERNTVLPNGVDMEMFKPRPQAEARAQVGWEQDAKIALFLGNPEDPRKRVELAQQAMELVSTAVPGARLEIGCGLEPSVIPTLMSAADCLVFPSRSEGSPNAIKEAMSCALPIVATPVGDIPERFRGVAGCFVCEPNPREFAAALVQALDFGPALAAREAVSEVSMQRISHRLRSLYEAVVEGGPLPVDSLPSEPAVAV